MAKFMIQFAYSVEGYKGLLAKKAASRDEAVRKLVGSLGGTLEVFYWTPTGEYTGAGIVDASHTGVSMFVATVMATGAFTACGQLNCYRQPRSTKPWAWVRSTSPLAAEVRDYDWRPGLNGVTVQLLAAEVEWLDAWIAARPVPIPTRDEAVNCILAEALMARAEARPTIHDEAGVPELLEGAAKPYDVAPV